MENCEYIGRNYRELCAEIRKYEEMYSRRITLVAVTKSGSDDELLALAEAGVTDIGENRPQELYRRGELLRSHGYSPALHEIGSLQRNKVKLVVGRAALIHSVDSQGLAQEISRKASALGITADILVEINSADENSKGGIARDEAEALIKEIRSLPSLRLRGLMTMGPVCDDPEDIRPYFRATRMLFDELSAKGCFDGEAILSMGMSDSYRVAIEEGATLVRVGRRIFVK